MAGFSSCDKEKTSAGVTDITYYPEIDMAGNAVVYIPMGGTYDDPGATAQINGEDVPVDVSSNLDASTVGSYAIGYSATNTDGFSKTVNRQVVVYDPNMISDDLSGSYTANVDRGGESYAGNSVTLTDIGVAGVTGVYEISDWIAGFYAVGRDYGANYAFTGLIQINGDNEVLELSMSNPWGDPFNSVVGSYDAGTNTISYTASWLSYEFVVDMTK
ncbi:MAG TPA: BT_2262 family domain-containing protein [Bacteroidales bacterium]|nr:BT_2262 family domain-containing protein [Bacteroidales bacterium]